MALLVEDGAVEEEQDEPGDEEVVRVPKRLVVRALDTLVRCEGRREGKGGETARACA